MRGKTDLLRGSVFALFLLVALCTAAAGEFIYVDDDVAGANSGASWEDAFNDLQDALAAAQEGDEIRMAQGIYTPSQDPLDREATFQLKDGVSIIGGYAGQAGMYPDFRHIKAFATILSGDIDHNDFGIDPNNKLGNSLHVVMCTGLGNTAVLEGVTITGGYAMPEVISHNYTEGEGGGLYCLAGSPELSDCLFTDNFAFGGGGATYVTPKSHPVFTRCIWEDNHAASGAAINARRSSYLISLNHCIFRRNAAVWRGGAIYSDIMGEVRMTNCLFVANTAGDSGGAIFSPRSSDGTGRSSYNLVNCTFYGNTSPTFNHPPTNTVKQPNGSRVYWSDSVIANCIFYNSIANEMSEIPVSFKFGSRRPLIITSIYEKEPGQGGIVPPMTDPLFVDPYGADGILGTEDDDFRLAPGSPAIDAGRNRIDAGRNRTEPRLPAMDLDGYPRILNDIVDMGAYESTDVFNVDADAPGS